MFMVEMEQLKVILNHVDSALHLADVCNKEFLGRCARLACCFIPSSCWLLWLIIRNGMYIQCLGQTLLVVLMV